MTVPINRKIVYLNDLSSLRAKYKDKKIGLCSGCFDVFHSGHSVFFGQCKGLCDVLVVSVGSDSVIRMLKGPGRPVNPQNNRIYLVASIGDVDYAIIGDEAKDMGSKKIDFYNIVENLKPDIFILNDDDSGIEEKQLLCKKFDIELKLVKRITPDFLKGVSSTAIINQIKND